MTFLCKWKNIFLKCARKYKRLNIVNMILSKNNIAMDISQSDFKIYYKVIVVKKECIRVKTDA